jgi:hypothetical protein
MTPEETVEALFATGSALYDAVLCGQPTDYQRKLWQWMQNPKPGDLVMGLTAFRHAKWQRVGTLLRIEDVRVCNHMRDDVHLKDCDDAHCLHDLPREHRFLERFYWLKTIYNEHRWYNERFIRIPRNEAELDAEVPRW